MNIKKVFFSISVLSNLVLIGYVLHNYSNFGNKQGHELGQNKKLAKVAILTPATHPSLDQIQNGFKDTLNTFQTSNYVYTPFNANGNKMLMRAQAEEIVQGNFDIVFTIGAQASQLVKELSIKKQKPVPIIFGAVSEPVRLGLVQSPEQPGGQVTGVIENTAFEKQVILLRAVKPAIKTIVLPYDPTQGAGLEKEKQDLEKILSKHDIKLISVEVYSVGEVYVKLQAFIKQADLVLVLKDHTVVAAIDSVIKLCNIHHIPLMTSELDSSIKGAVLSFGVREYDFGVYGARLARKILEEKVSAGTIPCVYITDYKLKINSKTIESQGLGLTPEQLLLYKSVEVV